MRNCQHLFTYRHTSTSPINRAASEHLQNKGSSHSSAPSILLFYSCFFQLWSWITPNNTTFGCVPNQTDLNQLTSSLVETPKLEMGISEKRTYPNYVSLTRVGKQCSTALTLCPYVLKVIQALFFNHTFLTVKSNEILQINWIYDCSAKTNNKIIQMDPKPICLA